MSGLLKSVISVVYFVCIKLCWLRNRTAFSFTFTNINWFMSDITITTTAAAATSSSTRIKIIVVNKCNLWECHVIMRFTSFQIERIKQNTVISIVSMSCMLPLCLISVLIIIVIFSVFLT